MLADFQSHVALGKLPITSDPTTRRMAEGISVFATLSQARRNARSFPDHGGFIAELSIPDLAPLTVARTGGVSHESPLALHSPRGRWPRLPSGDLYPPNAHERAGAAGTG